MNTKTTKTIVFAALIAAMVLPFGGMQAVYAADSIEKPEVPRLPNGDVADVTPQGESTENLPVVIVPDVILQGASTMELPEVIATDGGNTPDGATWGESTKVLPEVPVDQSEPGL